jgi:hypothetical protein
MNKKFECFIKSVVETTFTKLKIFTHLFDNENEL